MQRLERAGIVHAFTSTDGANVVLSPPKSMVVVHTVEKKDTRKKKYEHI